MSLYTGKKRPSVLQEVSFSVYRLFLLKGEWNGMILHAEMVGGVYV